MGPASHGASKPLAPNIGRRSLQPRQDNGWPRRLNRRPAMMEREAMNAEIRPLPPPIEGASAWIGAALARQPETWTYRLSPTDIAEIDAATAAVSAPDLDIAAIRRDDFPLPTLGPRLDRLRNEVLNGRGFVLIRGLPVQDLPIAASATAYWGIGTHFGCARSQNAKGHVLGHVRDLGLSSSDPRVRIYQTTERQNFHTDSCDIVALLCLKPAKRGGLSSLTSSMTVYNVMREQRPDLLARLFIPLATDRRGEVPDGKLPWFDIPVFNQHEGRLSAIYAPHYVRSSQRFPDARRLTAEDMAALEMFDRLAEDPTLRLDMEFRPGDMQFVHNHTTLHDRTAFEDWPEPKQKRHLLRLWLAAPGARPLPPAYAERYGSVTIGDRGGIICPGTRLHAPLEPV